MSRRKGNAFDAGVPGDARLLEAISRRTPKAAGMKVTHTHSGTIISMGKIRKKASISTPCPFGKIIVVAGDPYLQGGVLYGGDANRLVADYPIDLDTDIERLVWLEVGITANTEDSVLMPGLETCAAPTWETGTVAADYPDNTAPDITTGAGVRIVPLGILTVADGAATFDRTGCGNIVLGFCPPNTLSIART